MPRCVRDGRFGERPHYEPAELDGECEDIIVQFLRSIHNGEARFPVHTEDLKKLIERDADDLDCYADLSNYGADVEGVTEFRPGRKPVVRIAKALTEDERYENRLRTTLTHEFGHVRFHAYLYDLGRLQGDLFKGNAPQRLISKRENILGASKTDWMEWQAGYVCGAILMPVSHTRRIAREFLGAKQQVGPVATGTKDGHELIVRVSETFQVSEEAARIRLLKLNLLGPVAGQGSLFS